MDRQVLSLARAGLDGQLVVDVLDAGDGISHALGLALVLARADAAGQRDLTVVDLDRDVAGVEVAVLGQPGRDLVLDAGVGALRPLAGVWPLPPARAGHGLVGVAE